MRSLLFLALFSSLGCRFRGLPENYFYYPIEEGAIWYYEEDVPPDYPGPPPVDSIVVLKDTTVNYGGETLKAWKLWKRHESSFAGLVEDTNITFFHGNFIKEFLRTEGFFPDSVPYGSRTVYLIYEEDVVLVSWLPLHVKPGYEWVMTRSKGKIIIDRDTCSLTLDIWAVARGYEDVVYHPKTERFRGEKSYPKSLRVDYLIKGGICNLDVEITLLKVWWKSGIGPVKNVALTAGDSLVTYLVDYTF